MRLSGYWGGSFGFFSSKHRSVSMRNVVRNRSVAARRGVFTETEAPPIEVPDYNLGYGRVSGIESARGEISIPDQKNRISRWSEDQGLPVRKFYIDEGKSATNDKRPAFQKMVADIEQGKYRPRFIVAYDTSRLFRNRVDSELYERRLAKCGVSIATVTHTFPRTVPGVMSKNLMAELDQYIPMMTSVRVKETEIALAKQGFWPGGAPRYGIETYVVEKFGKKVRRKLRPRDNEAEIVRKVFDLSLNGDECSGPKGVIKIAEWLRINEIKTRRGSYFSPRTVHEMLTSRSYTGVYEWNYEAKDRPFVGGDEDKEVFTFHFEPVVDTDTFDRVQLKMQSQAKDWDQSCDTWVYQGSLLLRELTFCTCGGRLGLSSGTGKDGTVRRYYLCNRRKKFGRYDCAASRINELVLDKIVLGALKETVLDETRLGQLLKAWTEAEALEHAKQIEAGASIQAKADSAERELQRLLRLAKLDDDLASDPLFLKELSLARRGAAQARNKLAAIAKQSARSGEATPEQVAVFASMMRGILNGEDKERTKVYLRSLISRIEVGATEIRIFGDHGALGTLVSGKDAEIEAEDQENDSEVRTSVEEWCG
jgi:site-specific DNA recombinase